MTPYSVAAQNEWAGLFMTSPFVETIAREVSVRIRKRGGKEGPSKLWRRRAAGYGEFRILIRCLARERKELH